MPRARALKWAFRCRPWQMTRKVSMLARDKTSARVRVAARTVTTAAKARTRARARVVARRQKAAAKARMDARCKASSAPSLRLVEQRCCEFWPAAARQRRTQSNRERGQDLCPEGANGLSPG